MPSVQPGSGQQGWGAAGSGPPPGYGPPGYGPPGYGPTPGYTSTGGYGTPGAYGAPGGYGAGYAGIPQKTNGMAIASLVLGILMLCGVGSVLALIFGLIARKQIDESGGTQKGRGLAIAGIILGPVGIAILVVYIVVATVFIGTAARSLVKTLVPLANDISAQAALTRLQSDASAIVARDPNHSLDSVTLDSLRRSSSGVALSSMCGQGVVCVASGSSSGGGASYSYYQLCIESSSGSSWLISQTSASSDAWYGEVDSGACPAIGDPGTGTSEPRQPARWSTNAFPGSLFNIPESTTTEPFGPSTEPGSTSSEPGGPSTGTGSPSTEPGSASSTEPGSSTTAPGPPQTFSPA